MVKKQKLVKTPSNTNSRRKIVKKFKRKNRNNTEKSIISSLRIDQTMDHSSSDSDEDQNSPEKIQKLLEPYTKEQLMDFIIDAAANNPSLYTRILEAADRDVSHRKIFVYGLSWDTTKETLISAFKPFGEIEDCNVVIDRVTGKAKGFGFVQFKSRKEAMKALKEPKKKIGNRLASCQLASVGPTAAAGSTDTSSRKIYVSNVHQDVDPERLRAFFSKFGEIETGPLGFDSSTGKSRGFALFVYKNQEGFRKALEEPYKVFEGHQLHCQKAADGKNKGSTQVTATDITPVLQPPTPSVLAAVAAAQNLALFSQQQGLSFNPIYAGLFPNPNAGLLAANPLYASGALGQVGAVVGGAPAGTGAYSASADLGLNLGGDRSALGEYGGSAGPAAQGLGLQHAYPNKKGPPASGSRSQGSAGRSFSGYSSHLWYGLFYYCCLCSIGFSISLFFLPCGCFLVLLFIAEYNSNGNVAFQNLQRLGGRLKPAKRKSGGGLLLIAEYNSNGNVASQNMQCLGGRLKPAKRKSVGGVLRWLSQ